MIEHGLHTNIEIMSNTNHDSAGLQCVISADLPYCTDIDECLDTRPAFNKAADCGDHAVVIIFNKSLVQKRQNVFPRIVQFSEKIGQGGGVTLADLSRICVLVMIMIPMSLAMKVMKRIIISIVMILIMTHPGLHKHGGEFHLYMSSWFREPRHDDRLF